MVNFDDVQKELTHDQIKRLKKSIATIHGNFQMLVVEGVRDGEKETELPEMQGPDQGIPGPESAR